MSMTFAGPSHSAYVQPLYEELDEPSYTRRPRRLPLLAGTEEEANDSRLEPRYAPRRARWTSEPPEVEGLYFLRFVGTTTPLVVQVYRREDRAFWYGWSDVAARPVKRMPELEWSDRAIDMPVEPAP